MRKNKNIFQLLLVCVFACIVLSSCRKDELPSLNNGLTRLKVFSDSTASAENSSLKIAAGTDKLFMVYGCGAPSILVGGAIYTLDHRAKIIASDLNGNFLWQNSIGYNLDVGDVVALNDGGCIVASFDYWGTPDHDQQHIYLNRFDASGNSILVDSITLPSSLATNYFLWPVGSLRSTNGNIILYGTIYDLDDPVNSVKPFIGEYNLAGGWNWSKWYKLLPNATNESSSITSGVATGDGYLLTVIANEYAPGSSSSALLLKVDLAGDSIWSLKKQAVNDAWVGNSAVDYNGEVYFAYCLGAGNTTNNDLRYTGYISHLDANGSLLNTISVDEQTDNYITSLKVSGSGKVTALANKFGNTLFSYDDPIFTGGNTRYLRTGASLDITGRGFLQSETCDLIPAACNLPNGRTACFGLIQTKSRSYYKPALMILE